MLVHGRLITGPRRVTGPACITALYIIVAISPLSLSLALAAALLNKAQEYFCSCKPYKEGLKWRPGRREIAFTMSRSIYIVSRMLCFGVKPVFGWRCAAATRSCCCRVRSNLISLSWRNSRARLLSFSLSATIPELMTLVSKAISFVLLFLTLALKKIYNWETIHKHKRDGRKCERHRDRVGALLYCL